MTHLPNNSVGTMFKILAKAPLANKNFDSTSGDRTAIISDASSIISRYTVKVSTSAFNPFRSDSWRLRAIWLYIRARSFLFSSLSSAVKLVDEDEDDDNDVDDCVPAAADDGDGC